MTVFFVMNKFFETCLMNYLALIYILFCQTMERLRSHETGIFKKKPADLMQIFKVRYLCHDIRVMIM